MSKVQLNIWVEAEVRDRIRARASQLGVPLGTLIRDVIVGLDDLQTMDARVASLEEQVASLSRQLEGARGGY